MQKISNSTNSTSFETRISEVFEGAPVTQIAEKTGISYNKLRNYLTGRSDIPTSTLIHLAKITNCSIDWLLTGEGPKNKYVSEEFTESGISEEQLAKFLSFYDREIRKLMKRNNFTYEQAVHRAVGEGLIALGLATKHVKDPVKFKEVDYEIVMVPIVGRIAAGRPIEPVQDIRWQPCPRIWKVNEDVVMLEVNGDSMKDAGINDGDLVLVNKSRTAKRGDKIAALVDGEVTVKFYEPEHNRIRLDPANADYEPIYVYEHQTFEVYGVVIATVQV